MNMTIIQHEKLKMMIVHQTFSLLSTHEKVLI